MQHRPARARGRFPNLGREGPGLGVHSTELDALGTQGATAQAQPAVPRRTRPRGSVAGGVRVRAVGEAGGWWPGSAPTGPVPVEPRQSRCTAAPPRTRTGSPPVALRRSNRAGRGPPQTARSPGLEGLRKLHGSGMRCCAPLPRRLIRGASPSTIRGSSSSTPRGVILMYSVEAVTPPGSY